MMLYEAIKPLAGQKFRNEEYVHNTATQMNLKDQPWPPRS